MKIFVISEASFEYNDEIFSQGESEGGEPVEAYSTKEKAKEILALKTAEWLEVRLSSGSRYDSIGNYGYSAGDVINLSEFSNLTGLDGVELATAWDDGSIDKILKEHFEAAVGALEVVPFKITEIELNEAATAR